LIADFVELRRRERQGQSAARLPPHRTAITPWSGISGSISGAVRP